MSAVKLEKKEPLRLLQGGKSGDGNWLSGMHKGCRFLARKKDSFGPELQDYLVASVEFKAVLLGANLQNPQGGFIWVDPYKFCDLNVLFEVLRISDEDQRDYDRQPDMGDNADAKELDKALPEEKH